MNSGIIKSNFSKSANSYDANSYVQLLCARELLILNDLYNPRNILEIGCGTGAYTYLLHGEFPQSDIVSVDVSGEMIEMAKKKLRNKNISFLVRDEKDIPIKRKFDLITSNAALQWAEKIENSFYRYSSMLRDGGLFTFSVYGPETFCEFEDIISSYFGAKNITDASRFYGIQALREKLGKYFNKIDTHSVTYKSRFCSLMDFLKNIKFSGARGYGLRGGLSLGKNSLRDIENLYLEKYGSISVSHNIFFVKAKGDKDG